LLLKIVVLLGVWLAWIVPPRVVGSPPYLKNARAALDEIRWSVPTGLQVRIRAVAQPWGGW